MPDSNSFEVTFKETSTKSGLFCQFDEHHGVLLLDLRSPSLTKDDFRAISRIIDPYTAENGMLKGIIIHAKKFPYWSSPKNREEYIEFANNNHHKFEKAAFAMGGFFARIVLRIAKGRVHPKLKLFKYNQIEEAQSWILD